MMRRILGTGVRMYLSCMSCNARPHLFPGRPARLLRYVTYVTRVLHPLPLHIPCIYTCNTHRIDLIQVHIST